MCGRFVLFSSLDEIVAAFDVASAPPRVRTSYNIAPTQPVAVVLVRDGVRSLDEMVWGLIPAWAKDRGIGSRMINARAETLHQKPSFRRPLATQRCLVVADGFYEWRQVGNAKKPMYVHLVSRRPFGFAGLYDVWTSPEGETVHSCTIITTVPNELLQPIHDRMPVILPRAAEDEWLSDDVRSPNDLLRLLRPYPADEMVAYPVSRLVNLPQNDGPECIRPFEEDN
jgi:putative SOS response-associated peptidase YedK